MKRARVWPVLPALAALLSLYLIAPFLAGLFHIGLADWTGADWQGLGQATLVSLLSASAATLAIGLCGIPLGYLLARNPGRLTALLGFVVQLPLALPPLSSGILLLFLFGYASPIGALTSGALTDSFTGIVLAETFVAAPFLIIAARSAFAAVDPVLEDVARTLGRRPAAVFLRVSLPLAGRGILAGLLLAWLRAFGEFGATVMVAYHPYSLPVYTYVAFGSAGLPAMVPVLIPTLGAALLVMLAATGLARAPRSRAQAAAEEIAALPANGAKVAPRPQAFAFTLNRQLDGFALAVSHRTEARRIAILGPSGSGKSLTLRALAGLDKAPDDGVTLGPRDWSGLPAEARRIGYVPQSYGLFPHLTAGQQLSFATDADAAQARAWFLRLGLAGLDHRRPAELSLGQQQRVAIARALCRPTDLLLLDEPFSALDTPLRAQLRDDLRRLQGEIAATSVLVTHDPADAFALADEIIILDHGRVLQAGPAETVFARPMNALAARLLGAEAASPGRAVAPDRLDIGGGVILAVGGPPLRPGALTGWSIAPTHLRLVAGGGLPAEILSVAPPAGGAQRAILRIGDAERPLVQAPDAELKPGPVQVLVPPAALQIWEADGAAMPR